MDTIAFARGVPAPDMLPVDDIRAAADRVLVADPVRILSYGTGGGYPPLREVLAAGHGVDADRVVVTTGSLQGFALLAEVIGRSVDGRRPVALVENPTYDRPLIVLERLGWDVVAIPTDEHGIDADAAAEAIRTHAPDLVYVIPTFQNPAGVTLVEARRSALVAAAAAAGVLLFEDDPYGSLHFDAPAPRSLFERSDGSSVIYSSSFSKTVSPGLRVGYMVLPPGLAAAVTTHANDTYISSAGLDQAIVADLLEHGRVDASIAHSRALLARRCDVLGSALDAHLPEATWTRPHGGYFAWITLPGSIDTASLLASATAAGVTYVPGSAFGPGNERSIRLAFSSPAIDLIDDGIVRLASVLEGVPTTA